MAKKIAVIGAGISGISASEALLKVGFDVSLFDQGKAPGGRLGLRTLKVAPNENRNIDVGAAYFTAQDSVFDEKVNEWISHELAFEWKEDFQVIENNQRITKSGPGRYVVKNGIKNLVFFELEKIKNEISFFKDTKVEAIELSGEKVVVNKVEFDAAVLAMPAPQAARIVFDEKVQYELSQVKFNPVLVAWVALGELEKFAGIFVNQDSDISLLINEGSKQNDGANVLTIYSTHEFASNEINYLEIAKVKLIEKAKKLLNNSSDEIESGIMRWTLAQPEFSTRPKLPSNLAIVGDAYAENPRIENAWLDGSRVLDQLSAIL